MQCATRDENTAHTPQIAHLKRFDGQPPATPPFALLLRIVSYVPFLHVSPRMSFCTVSAVTTRKNRARNSLLISSIVLNSGWL